jgi:hypothetical protein
MPRSSQTQEIASSLCLKSVSTKLHASLALIIGFIAFSRLNDGTYRRKLADEVHPSLKIWTGDALSKGLPFVELKSADKVSSPLDLSWS